MLKKRNLLFLSLLILIILLLSSCFFNPIPTEGILKGQVLVPEGTFGKDLTGQALPDATVNIIDLATGEILATTTTDSDGTYQVSVPPGGPYLLESIKDGIKIQQITPQVEVGIEYDLGIADCVTTASALIAQAMMDAGDNPADIDCAAIAADSNFNDVSSIVCSTIQAGQDPTTSTVIEQEVEDFLNPPPPTPSLPSTYTVTYNGNGSTSGTVPSGPYSYKQGSSVTVLENTGSLVKTGYTFSGWNTQADDNGTGQTEGSTFTMGTSNVTLYAQWTINNYNIIFNKNDTAATGTMVIQTIAYGSSATLNTCAFTKTDYTFAGWAETPTGDINYDDEDSYTMGASNLTLYAKWNIYPVHNITKDTYYTAIQVALYAADSVDGDTIEVADGTYPGSIIFPSDKLITLQSSNGPDFTTITGTLNAQIILFWNSPEGTTLNGFTINNESGDTDIRGIYVNEGCYLTIDNCIISNNTTTSSGCGIYNYGILVINDSTISGNANEYTSGGGIYNNNTLTITGSTISGNAACYGGGIFNSNVGTLTITGSTISGNTAIEKGGGIFTSGLTTIGGADASDKSNFNVICGNTPDQINFGNYPNNYIFTTCNVIGQTRPAGGLIFYDKGSVSDGWRYLEAAPSDQSTGWDTEWGCVGTAILGADGQAVGTGEQNTIDIEAGCTTPGTAADICANLSLGGYNDWFLPSKDELNLMYENLYLYGVGGLSDYYWSSSEYALLEEPANADYAWRKDFPNGWQYGTLKSLTLCVRAVRAF